MNALEIDVIRTSAERRWRETRAQHPELGPAIDVQGRLFARTLQLTARIEHDPPYRVDLGVAAGRGKLSAGQPLLAGEPAEVDASVLRPFVLGFCRDLETDAAAGAAGRLHDMLAGGAVEIGSLVAASLTRRQDAIRTRAHHLGASPDLLWLVAELAAGPIAHHWHLTTLDHPTMGPATLHHWSEGYCPACGSWPALGELSTAQVSTLRCSFCGCAWLTPPRQCIYCQTGGASWMTVLPDPGHIDDRLPHHLQMCRECGGYLKILAVDAPVAFLLLPVEDLATSHLDVGAAERGYGRPSMHRFPDAGPCPPPGR